MYRIGEAIEFPLKGEDDDGTPNLPTTNELKRDSVLDSIARTAPILSYQFIEHPTLGKVTGLFNGRELVEAFQMTMTFEKEEVTCQECKAEIKVTELDGWSACLVNHADNMACLQCPECEKAYIPNVLKWHRKDINIKDFEEDE